MKVEYDTTFQRKNESLLVADGHSVFACLPKQGSPYYHQRKLVLSVRLQVSAQKSEYKLEVGCSGGDKEDYS